MVSLTGVESYDSAHLFKAFHLSLIRISLHMVLKPFVLCMYATFHRCSRMPDNGIRFPACLMHLENLGNLMHQIPKLPGLSLGTVPGSSRRALSNPGKSHPLCCRSQSSQSPDNPASWGLHHLESPNQDGFCCSRQGFM